MRKLLPRPSAAAPTEDWTATGPWVRLGRRVVVYMFGGLVVGSALISIAGAVIAPGTVTVESNYKTVQHLDGGIVSKILVRNGDRVKAGDVLVRLEDTAVRANHTITAGRVNDLRIQQARLEAERERKAAFDPPAGIDVAEPAIAKVLEGQRALFEARTTTRLGEQSVLSQRLTQLGGEQKGLESQLGARKKEREINGRELSSVMPLFEQGYVNQQRVAPLQREQARLDGDIGRLTAEIAKVQSAVSETTLRLAQAEKTYTETVVDELRKVQAQLAEQEQAGRTLADKLERIEIRAPRAGRIHGLAVHTEGGVVTPASPILQIIPDDEKLIIEAHLPPQDIDKVRQGSAANIRFPAFNAHTTPRLEGLVARVSPAQTTDAQGRSYFTAEVEIPARELTRIPDGQRLVPGMPAEVFIATTSRSILSYFVKPLTDAMTRAFRE